MKKQGTRKEKQETGSKKKEIRNKNSTTNNLIAR